ncbi:MULTISPECIES: ATP-binding cassette domain-containing protein [Actinoalloteichus]|uniref:ABC transporter/Oligopeptide/dipeptide transporter, C-terminal region n=1 Tax=Actinoalloteichus fjordicus TaxID=1612552 RepID=A0AAC9LEL4_9PSEU|nr:MULTISPECIES: ATP-binding cassette domain-containing protein [Actinoalloteichus]APU15435.1 ABC transporter/Oligopeptide/dipeptide transporter, C-terminal region [Actinoalloteichus fjordicus]APU21503.1 ABC transporter/Oligopeptide/dipeptide transporter, C-terminal region [Actinoalloteichus sp. GBA129-24]
MNTPILAGRNLVREYATGGRRGPAFRAVDDVTLEVGASETLAVVGESGSGKSSTARLLARLDEPTSGTIELDGEDVTSAPPARLRTFRRTVQVVFQDPYSSLNPRHDVEKIITAPLRYQGLSPRKGGTQICKELMERVGLNPDHSTRYPHQFSGGQAQRIGIARALAVNPKVVICDEAVSALDVSVQAQVIDLLRDLQRDLGLSYVFIAHDLAVVRRLADRVAVMSGGRVVEQGSRDQVFDAPREEYTRALLAAVPRINPEWERRRREWTPPEGQD